MIVSRNQDQVMRRIRALQILTSAAAAAGLSASVFGANGADTWVGNTDTNWANAANWTGANTPPISGDPLVFGTAGSAGATLNESLGALSVAGLNFDSANAAYVINPANVSANTLDFISGAVISNNSAFLQTINTEAVGSASFTVQGSGNITMQRVRMSNSAANNVLTMNGTGILTLGDGRHHQQQQPCPGCEQRNGGPGHERHEHRHRSRTDHQWRAGCFHR